MYSFILSMYRMGRIEKETVKAFAEKGLITQAQAQCIMAVSEE